ncbi:unnamed protein product [Dicrocoelium dendriticum]|nr:unnamed protein product [Dicrocoelium dendriticum]
MNYGKPCGEYLESMCFSRSRLVNHCEIVRTPGTTSARHDMRSGTDVNRSIHSPIDMIPQSRNLYGAGRILLRVIDNLVKNCFVLRHIQTLRKHTIGGPEGSAARLHQVLQPLQRNIAQ